MSSLCQTLIKSGIEVKVIQPQLRSLQKRINPFLETSSEKNIIQEFDSQGRQT